ncbi:hypothetical protein CMT57_09875 [Elizabethkingia anophelis]|nr:hypothetical protein BBD30_12145 [Elizabethkingia anophelis]MDV3950835.1 hypothetical protein [Elizabethkingia anophelis]MDV4010131.1 hypothetical protein [Elizabethkingia anophelis]OPB60904.1 hypothetical protein BAS07_17215 [Elizabethkingia anophelis]
MPPQQTNDDIYFHPCKDRMPILHKRVTYVTFSLIQIFQQFFFLKFVKKTTGNKQTKTVFKEEKTYSEKRCNKNSKLKTEIICNILPEVI